MASGDDPIADFQTTMGLQGLMGPNPYLKYQGQIPMAGFYTGQGGAQGPTDAMGNPIQSFTDANNAAQQGYQQQLAAYNAQGQGAGQGTTLNSSPFASVPNVQGQNAPATEPRGGLNLQQWNALSPQQRSSAMGPLGQYAAGNAMMPSDSFVANHNNPSGGNPQAQTALALMNSGISGFNQMAQGPGQGAAPSRGPAPTPPDMRQAYLDALANPGKVNTPGAQMLPGTTPTGPVGAGQQPSVMQAFLAAHPQGGTPAPAGGGYSNQGFFNTLNALQQGHPQ